MSNPVYLALDLPRLDAGLALQEDRDGSRSVGIVDRRCPVMQHQIRALSRKPQFVLEAAHALLSAVVFDATFGAGGYTRRLLDAGATVIGVNVASFQSWSHLCACLMPACRASSASR